MKKMNKKGFTLIELLAIIVILAIIAVITVPLILGIIDEAREGADKSSVIGYGKAVELAYSKSGVSNEEPLSSCTATDGSCIAVSIDSVTKYFNVTYSGAQVVCSGNNEISDGKLTLLSCVVGTDSNADTWTYDNGEASKDSAQSNNG